MGTKTRQGDPCGIGEVLRMVSGRWKGLIIWWLRDEPRRFSELRKLMPNVTQRVLTTQLRQLELDGLISRNQFDEMPVRVEYALTPLGQSLVPLLDQIRQWSADHLNH